VTSRLGMGMSLTFFYGVQWVKNGARNRVKRMGSGRGARRSKLFLPYEHAVLLKEITNMLITYGNLEHPESHKNLKAIEDRKAGTPRKDGMTERTADQNIDGAKYPAPTGAADRFRSMNNETV
jgi:hypothetical protein